MKRINQTLLGDSLRKYRAWKWSNSHRDKIKFHVEFNQTTGQGKSSRYELTHWRYRRRLHLMIKIFMSDHCEISARSESSMNLFLVLKEMKPEAQMTCNALWREMWKKFRIKFWNKAREADVWIQTEQQTLPRNCNFEFQSSGKSNKTSVESDSESMNENRFFPWIVTVSWGSQHPNGRAKHSAWSSTPLKVIHEVLKFIKRFQSDHKEKSCKQQSSHQSQQILIKVSLVVCWVLRKLAEGRQLTFSVAQR